MDEFLIIDQFFKKNTQQRNDVVIGIGDDGAVVQVPDGQQLVLAIDTLVENIHFPPQANSEDLGFKSLAVNLSDLAAMGATPAWATLALTLPHNDEAWLQRFCQGFFSLLNQYEMQLIGGDLTQGPLTISCQVHGFVSPKNVLKRKGAREGDLIYVSGNLGDAGLALACLNNKNQLSDEDKSVVFNKYYRPQPRIELGHGLQSIASSVIDISDGLIADLSHILRQSNKGAELWIDKIPISTAMKNNLSHEDAINMALSAGDDYELCFTIPANKQSLLHTQSQAFNVNITCVGKVTQGDVLKFINKQGQDFHPTHNGYKHFT